MTDKTNDGKKGGITKGKRHSQGGIKAVVVDTGQLVELEGGEVIINREASRKHCKQLSLINQSAGGGVPIPCDDITEIQGNFEQGGQLSLFDDFNVESDIDPKELQPAKIEKRISEIANKYSDEFEPILKFKKEEIEQQRLALLSWIKNPANKVKVIIAFSGGKDSVAMVLRSIFEWKIPREQIELWHHDVDGDGEDIFDWKCTKSYCKAFAKAMGVPILFSYSGGGIMREVLRGVGTDEKRIPYDPPRYQQIKTKDENGNEIIKQGAELFKTDQPETRQPIYFQVEPDGEFMKSEPRAYKGNWAQDTGDFKVKGKFPAVVSDLKTRWCSSVAKIEVMSRAINNSPNIIEANVVIMTGERRQESPPRDKYKEIEKYDRASSKSIKNGVTWRCVIDMLEDEVWELFKKYKIQPHPCYELGWGRCSCQLCIFSSANVWAANYELSPLKVARIAEVETLIQHPLYYEHEKLSFEPKQYVKSGKTKGQEKFEKGRLYKNVFESKVQFGKSFIPKDILDRWKDEALGEFVSPIIVKGEWKLPLGAKNSEQAGAI